MPKEGARFDTTIDLKTLIHVVSLLAAFGAAFLSFQEKVNSVSTDLSSIRKQTTRIEHYLSANDQQYWKKTHENGDSER